MFQCVNGQTAVYHNIQDIHKDNCLFHTFLYRIGITCCSVVCIQQFLLYGLRPFSKRTVPFLCWWGRGYYCLTLFDKHVFLGLHGAAFAIKLCNIILSLLVLAGGFFRLCWYSSSFFMSNSSITPLKYFFYQNYSLCVKRNSFVSLILFIDL